MEETRVRALTTVPLAPGEAFALFTEQVDAWWRRGPRYRAAIDGREGAMRFECGVGGRLLEDYGPGRDAFVLGEIRVWEPGERLVLSMGGRDFAPGEWTEVEVRFEAAPGGTRVSVEHRGFDALGPGHAVWHGQERGAFVGAMGLWWGDLLVALRAAGGAPR